MRAILVALSLCLVASAALAGATQTGIASRYSVRDADQTGTRTASGIPLDDNKPTAAHKSWPLHAPMRVTNLSNGRSITVRITDRGPYVRGRIVDLSVRAAQSIDCSLCKVRAELLPSEGR